MYCLHWTEIQRRQLLQSKMAQISYEHLIQYFQSLSTSNSLIYREVINCILISKNDKYFNHFEKSGRFEQRFVSKKKKGKEKYYNITKKRIVLFPIHNWKSDIREALMFMKKATRHEKFVHYLSVI